MLPMLEKNFTGRSQLMAKKGKAKARKRSGKRSVKDLSPRSAKGKSVKGGASSANNLKQIGLALHNYAGVSAQIGKSINPA
jgi:hypothetical protein